VENVDLWILPTMNPDGFERGSEGRCEGGSYATGRYNEGRKDLNRDFPTWRDFQELNNNNNNDDKSFLFERRQKETKLLMKWILEYPFVLSANFHDGAIVANYPYDDYRPNRRIPADGIHRSPDHDVFYHLATTYSFNHAYMVNTSVICSKWPYFKDGVTNGAQWYPVVGGMQDFNYIFSNAMELTIEVSCCKYPERQRLLPEWSNNVNSILSYVEQSFTMGIKGLVVTDDVTDDVTGVNDARVYVRRVDVTPKEPWRTSYVTTDSQGHYWRLLLPGVYRVKVVKGRLRSRVRRALVGKDQPSTVLNFTLRQANPSTTGRN